MRHPDPRFDVTVLPVGACRIQLKDAIAYALSVQGSGFRERLCEGSGRASGLPEADTRQIAQALEYFHHASLLLDDLPCMDDAQERRGQPSAHVVYGEGRTLLTALALINRAYIGCWQTASQYPVQSQMAARLVSRTIGEQGILDGQDRDLHFSSALGADEVREVARLKTGCLIELVLMLPAILMGSPFGELLLLSRLARSWGRLYQGIDDFKDLLIGDLPSGKTPCRDRAHNRPNLVYALGPEQAAAELFDQLDASDRYIAGLVARHSRWSFLKVFQSEFRARGQALIEAVEAA